MRSVWSAVGCLGIVGALCSCASLTGRVLPTSSGRTLAAAVTKVAPLVNPRCGIQAHYIIFVNPGAGILEVVPAEEALAYQRVFPRSYRPMWDSTIVYPDGSTQISQGSFFDSGRSEYAQKHQAPEMVAVTVYPPASSGMQPRSEYVIVMGERTERHTCGGVFFPPPPPPGVASIARTSSLRWPACNPAEYRVHRILHLKLDRVTQFSIWGPPGVALTWQLRDCHTGALSTAIAWQAQSWFVWHAKRMTTSSFQLKGDAWGRRVAILIQPAPVPPPLRRAVRPLTWWSGGAIAEQMALTPANP